MRIQRQSETFAFRMAADQQSPFMPPKKKDEDVSTPDVNRKRNINALPRGHDPSAYQSDEATDGPRMQKLVPTQFGTGNSAGGNSFGGGSGIGNGNYRVAPGGGQKNQNNLLPGTQRLNDILKGMYPNVEIGGYREDPAYPDEHPAGKALDFMTKDLNQGRAVIDTAWQNGADYAIWQNQMWYPNGTTAPYTGPNPHTDHVHIHHPGGI